MDITNLIGSVGFPIVACIYLMKMLNDERKRHSEETEQLRKAIADNTLILSQLKTLFETMTGVNHT